MRKLILFFVLVACRAWAADGVAAFENGLKAFQTNGADALLSAWYRPGDDTEAIGKVRARLVKISQGLGPAIDTQVFAPHDLGRHVQRLYGVIYFEKRPLWLRAEYYEINGRGGFISLEFSLSADDILPLALTPAQS